MFEVPEEEDTGGIKTTIRIVDVENIKNIVNTARRAKNKYFSAETFDNGDLDPIQIAELMKLALDNTKARQLIEGLNLDPQYSDDFGYYLLPAESIEKICENYTSDKDIRRFLKESGIDVNDSLGTYIRAQNCRIHDEATGQMFVLDGDMNIQGRVVGLATLDYYDDGIRAAILLTNPLLINDYETIDYYKSSKIYVILENGARFSEIRFSEDNLGSDE